MYIYIYTYIYIYIYIFTYIYNNNKMWVGVWEGSEHRSSCHTSEMCPSSTTCPVKVGFGWSRSK